ARAASLLRSELEIGLGGGCALEQAACRLELRRLRAVGRARDRELDLRDVIALAREWQRLEWLGGRAVERDQFRIAGRLDDLAVPDDDGVDPVHRLDERASPHGYAE